MTDDLEPRLEDHLRQRASRVPVVSGLDDVHQRIGRHERRRTRALGVALAIALVAGPVVGFAAARSTEDDRDTVSASGGEGAGTGDDTGSSTNDNLIEGVSPGYLDPEMELVSERTTEEGIRLVVHSTILGARPDGGPCVVDGLVRVGIEDGQLIDVALFDTSPTGASFGIAGGTDGRPMWVVVTRGHDSVTAIFPNGRRDTAQSANDVAVLAAYADDGRSAEELSYDVVEIDGVPAAAGAEHDIRQVLLNDGSGGCPDTVAQPIDPPVTMPEPGEPPADEDAARAEIEEMWESSFGYGEGDLARRERPAVYADAVERFEQDQPEYFAWAKQVYAEVDEIVFTAPDRASVRATLKSDDPGIPVPEPQIGEAVLIDGVWKVSIESSCSGFALAGIECDMSIEG